MGLEAMTEMCVPYGTEATVDARKLSGKHPLDGETFLNKNREQRTNYSIIRSYYTSDYWQPGALVMFFNYISGLLFPKKITQSLSGSITFRRVGFPMCNHR